jgi:hypothetical protein
MKRASCWSRSSPRSFSVRGHRSAVLGSLDTNRAEVARWCAIHGLHVDLGCRFGVFSARGPYGHENGAHFDLGAQRAVAFHQQVARTEPCEILGSARVARCAPGRRFAVSGLLPLETSHMNQIALYTIVRDAGFTVLVFEDHPQFFGNWRAHIKRGHDVYEIVGDNREGWLTLWRQDTGKGEKLFETESFKLEQVQELAQVKRWLEATKSS